MAASRFALPRRPVGVPPNPSATTATLGGMARRADPERIDEARRAALCNALTGTGMSPETAERWLAAWADEAASRGLQRSAAYWTAAAVWIAAERVKRRGVC